MYKIIADSGSTKTDWVLLNGSKVITRVNTIGFNPYFQTGEAIRQELKLNLNPHIEVDFKDVSGVYYYGTGCSTSENCELVSIAITQATGIQNVQVSHDLLAAARALCQNEWGIAAILGTGSNSCLYNGKQILENVPSTGYLWADYGGGSQIGKYFIRDYFEGRLPKQLCLAFEAEGYNREEILNNVYKKPVPSKYLAKVSLFVSKYIHESAVQNVLNECFNSFFEQQVNKYTDSKKYKVHSVGSIGFYYKDFIAKVAAKHGYKMGTVIKSPIEGLIDFHSQN